MLEALSYFFTAMTKIVLGITISLFSLLGIYTAQPVSNEPNNDYVADSTSTKEAAQPAKRIESRESDKPAKREGETKTNTVSKSNAAINTKPANPTIYKTPAINGEKSNKLARSALVNILCTTKSGGSFNPISGSGVVIDPRGVVLTNAHIGQYFLLEDYSYPGFMDCIIRTGSPATPAYDATLLYISPKWIRENAAAITQEDPKGTGENDFALLLINRSIRPGKTLPVVFPFLDPDLDESNYIVGSPVLIASYPAGFLGGTIVQKNLYQASAFTNIKNVYTFTEKNIDLVSLGGSIVAQKGSSGSGVTNIITNKILGIIVTSTTDESTSKRDLNAITLSYISRSISTDLGVTLKQFLAGNLAMEAQSFNDNVAPTLRVFLEQALK